MSVAEYVIELFDSGASFGPGSRIGELWSARNLGWSAYDRIPGKAFATLAQSDVSLAWLSPLKTHVKIWRLTPTSGPVLVYAGGFIDYDSTGDDVVLTFYDYLALLSVSRSGYQKMYPNMALGDIALSEWNMAKLATASPLAFVATGTFENPLASDGITQIRTNGQFGTLDQMRLQILYDLSEMGRANTSNTVTFGIGRTDNTMRFLRNAGTRRDIGLVLGGSVSDYAHAPNWSKYRNDLATLGTSSAGGAMEIVKQDATAAASMGLRQDVFTIRTLLGVAGAATEVDQQQAVAARELRRATGQHDALSLQLIGGFIEPFVGWDINDVVPVEIDNGIDSVVGDWRIVGVRVLFDEAGEQMSLLVAPVLT